MNLDKTGPRGQGPLTGRGLGICKPEFNPDDKPKKQGEEFEEDIKYPRRRDDLRRGFGRGLGFGRGFGWRRFSY